MMPNLTPFVLTVGGSDSSGAAGIQADLKTFQAHRVYGLCALTIVTAQNSLGIKSSRVMDASFVLEQIQAVNEVPISAVKTGLLLRPDLVEAVSKGLATLNASLIVDPVLVAGDGRRLTDDATLQAYRELLFPRATLITPNADETQLLTGVAVNNLKSMRQAAVALQRLVPNVLIKGANHSGKPLVDILFDGRTFYKLTAERLPVNNPRGAGDTYTAAIAARLASGDKLYDAVHRAKQYVTAAIRAALERGVKSGSRDVLLHINA